MVDSRSLGMFACLVSLSVGCGEPLRARCGKRLDSGACVSVLAAVPYLGTANLDPNTPITGTSNVDISQGLCETEPGSGIFVPEPFTDHNLAVYIANDPPPELANAPDLAPVVRFDNYRMDFELGDCPPGATCPDISPVVLEPGPTVTVRGGETAVVVLPVFPLRKKLEYTSELGSPTAYPSYTVHLLLERIGVDGKELANLRATTELTIGAFDYCSLLKQ